MRCSALFAIVSICAAPVVAQAQSSAAVRWLARQAIEQNCQGQGGRFGPGGLIEADFTGDGRDDLVIFSGAIECGGGVIPCGMSYCDATLFVRDGDLLKSAGSGFNTMCAELVPGDPPGLRICDRHGGTGVYRWNGRELAREAAAAAGPRTAGLDGLWSVDPASCVDEYAEDRMIVRGDELVFHESVCRLGASRPATTPAGALTYESRCEGHDWSESGLTTLYATADGRLGMIAENGHRSFWHRCR
jgi:hypothetical protein